MINDSYPNCNSNSWENSNNKNKRYQEKHFDFVINNYFIEIGIQNTESNVKIYESRKKK